MSGDRPDDPLNQPTEELPALSEDGPGPESGSEPGPTPEPGPADAGPGPAPAPEPAATEPLPLPEASRTAVLDAGAPREPAADAVETAVLDAGAPREPRPPEPRPVAGTRRPRRRGGIRALVAVVVVLAVAAVGAELYARSRIEAVVRSALPGLSADATISADGLVLPQIMGSRLNTLTIDADSLTLTRADSAGDDAPASMTLSDLNATLTGVSLARPRTIDAAAVTGVVVWSEISAIVRARVPRLPPDLAVEPETLGSAGAPGAMIASSSILGSDTSLILEPSLTADGGLLLSVTRATVRGVELDLDDDSASAQILRILGMDRPEIAVGPEILPAGAALSSVAVARKGLALTISGKNLSLGQF